MPATIDSMQQEAMRRVQEMHARTHNAAHRTQPAPTAAPAEASSPNLTPNSASTSVPPTEPPTAVQNENRAPVQSMQSHPEETGGNLLETVFHDKERSLILLLILILTNESTKPEALLALMYLIM